MSFRSIFLDGKISNPLVTDRVMDFRFFGEDSIPYAQSANITLGRGTNLDMSLTLAPTYDKALELLSKDNPWIRLGNTLGVRWGYADVPGAVSDWYYGFMLMPEVSFGEEITITLTAQTLTWNTNLVERTRVWSTEESPLTLKEIADQIAQRYGLKTDFNEGALGQDVLVALQTPRSNFAQGGRTDRMFLMQEAEILGLRMIERNGILYFVDQAAPLPGEPSVNATFQMYGRMDPWNNVFPLSTFDPENIGTMFIQNKQALLSFAKGPNDDPEADVEPVVSSDADARERAFSADTTLSAPSTEDGPPPIDMGDVKVKSTVKVEHDQGEAGRIFNLPLNGDETSEFINAQVSAVRESDASGHGIGVAFGCAIALPNLLPGMFVKLEGVGDYFSTTYLLNDVEISIGDGGASMECKGIGKGFPNVDRQLDPFAGRLKTYEDVKVDTWFDNLFTDVKEPLPVD
jgi:hypothetical protein